MSIPSEPTLPWNSVDGPFDGSRYTGARLQPPLQMRWKLPITNRMHDGECVGHNGVLYVPVRGTDVMAVNLITGQQLWTVEGVRHEGGVMLCGDFLVCAENVLYNERSVVVDTRTQAVSGPPRKRFDVRSQVGTRGLLTSTGLYDLTTMEELWTAFPIPVTHGNGRTFLTLSFSGLYCYDLRRHQTLWRCSEELRNVRFLYSDEQMYILFDHESGRHLALDADDGSVIWSRRLGLRQDDRQDYFTCAGDRIFIGGHTDQAEAVIRGLDKETGKTLWRSRALQQLVCPMVATKRILWAHGMIQAPMRRFLLVALSMDKGEVLIEMQLKGPLQSIGVVDDCLLLSPVGTVYCCCGSEDE